MKRRSIWLVVVVMFAMSISNTGCKREEAQAPGNTPGVIDTVLKNQQPTATAPAAESEHLDSALQTRIDPNADPYTGLRGLALSMKAEDIGVKVSGNQPQVYGVVIDENFGEGTSTTAAFLSGDASLYASTGQMLLGGVGHEAVKKAAIDLVSKAQLMLPKAVKTSDQSLPSPMSYKFTLLTNKGMFVASESKSSLDANSSPWQSVFIARNIVIEEMQKASPQQH